jgi:hypothetical protein
METQLLFDKLAYVDRLTKAGIDESQARAFSDALEEALRESVATRVDITALRTDMRTEVARLEHRIDLAVRDLKIWVGGIAIVLFTALVAVRFFVH